MPSDKLIDFWIKLWQYGERLYFHQNLELRGSGQTKWGFHTICTLIRIHT